VTVVAVDTVLGFRRREDQFIAPAELGEGAPVLAHQAPSLLDLLRIAEDDLGPGRGQLQGCTGGFVHEFGQQLFSTSETAREGKEIERERPPHVVMAR
jgi:hypothetical protein